MSRGLVVSLRKFEYSNLNEFHFLIRGWYGKKHDSQYTDILGTQWKNVLSLSLASASYACKHFTSNSQFAP